MWAEEEARDRKMVAWLEGLRDGVLGDMGWKGLHAEGKAAGWASILSGLAQGRRPPTAQGIGSPEPCEAARKR